MPTNSMPTAPESGPAARIGVVVIAENGFSQKFEKTLSKLLAEKPDQIVVVQNGPDKDPVSQRAKEILEEIKCPQIVHRRRVLLSKCYIDALKLLDTDYVMFVLADSDPVAGYFALARQAIAQHPKIDMVFGRLCIWQWRLRPDVKVSWSENASQLMTPEQHFESCFKQFGPFVSLAASTLFKVSALHEMQFPALLEGMPMLPEALIVHLLAARSPSYFIDSDAMDIPATAWTASERVSATEQQLKYYARAVSSFLRTGYCASLFTDEQYGLYVHRLWQSAETPSGFWLENQLTEPQPPLAEPGQALPTPTVIIPPKPQTLSALICNYNHAQFLPEAIEAVIAQKRRPDELLILDDGSTDGSFDIMCRYAEKYPWIKVGREERNQGYISGIQKLTQMARGDFIHRGTSDDYMLPNFVERLMEMADRYPMVGIISGKMANRSEGDKTESVSVIGIRDWKTGYISPWRFRHEYLEEDDPTCTLAPSTIYRCQAVRELGGWREELDTWDVSFVLQAAALKYGMAYVDEPVYTWVYRKRGWTHTSNSDVAKSLRMSMNFYKLITSPLYRHLYGTRFPDRWIRANLSHFLRTTEEAQNTSLESK